MGNNNFYSGTMTEVSRIDCGKLCVVVSYWTKDGGKSCEPRVRFVVGQNDQAVKSLTKAQALAVRDAFNSVCDEWSSPSAPAPKAPKKSSRPAPSEDKQSGKTEAELAAADAIADMFRGM